MSYNRPRHGRQSLGQKASVHTRGVIAGSAVAAAAAGTLAAGSVPAAYAATTPLSVTLGTQVQGDGSSAVFNGAGDPVLTLGTGTGTTGAYIDIRSAIGQPLPAAEPAFTTSAFSTGSPRFWIKLSNGAQLMSNQASSTSPTAAGAAGWSVNLGNGWSNTLATYTQAVTAALQGGTGVTVADAQIIADGDQAPGTADVITAITYNGQGLAGGTVTAKPEANQASVLGTPVTPVKIGGASATVSDQAIAYTVANLPKGLSYDAATGLITGTPVSAGARIVTVTAADAYGDKGSVTFTWTVAAHAKTQEAYLYDGHVISVSNNRAQAGWTFGPGVTAAETFTYGPGMSTGNTDPHPGYTTGTTGYWEGLQAGHTYDIEYIAAHKNAQGQVVADANAQHDWITVVTTR